MSTILTIVGVYALSVLIFLYAIKWTSSTSAFWSIVGAATSIWATSMWYNLCPEIPPILAVVIMPIGVGLSFAGGMGLSKLFSRNS